MRLIRKNKEVSWRGTSPSRKTLRKDGIQVVPVEGRGCLILRVQNCLDISHERYLVCDGGNDRSRERRKGVNIWDR